MMSNRRFASLRWCAALLTALGIASCGGSDDEQALAPDTPFAEKAAALTWATTALATSGLDFSNFESGAAAFATTLKDSGKFEDVGFDVTEDRLIWMRLADGTTFVIPFNRKPSGSAPAEPVTARTERALSVSEKAAVSSAVGYPSSAQSALLYTFTADNYDSAIGKIRPLLTNAGYDQAHGASGVPYIGSLDDFLNLQDVGLLYVDGHGISKAPKTKDPSGQNWLYLSTNTDYTADVAAKYDDDFKNQRLVVGIESHNLSKMVMMSDVFVKAHVKVAPKALIIINTCWNGSSDRMANAFFANGAGTVLGWDKAVEDEDAYGTSLYLFDRLLGQQTLIPAAHASAEPKWPTLVAEVLADMLGTFRPGRSYSFATDRTGANLKSYLATDTSSQIVPSIRVVASDRANNLIRIYGQFGPDVGSVRGDPASSNVALTIRSWTTSEIDVTSVDGLTQIQVQKGTLLSNVAGIPNAEFTIAEESVPAGNAQRLIAHMDVPKSALARGALDTTLIVNNSDKLKYTVGFPPASAAVALADTNFSAYLIPSSNIVTSLDAGTYNFPALHQGFPVIFDNGDRLVIALKWAYYGGTTGLTLADAQNSVRAYTSTVKLRITKSLFSPVNTTVTFAVP